MDPRYQLNLKHQTRSLERQHRRRDPILDEHGEVATLHRKPDQAIGGGVHHRSPDPGQEAESHHSIQGAHQQADPAEGATVQPNNEGVPNQLTADLDDNA